MPVRTDYHISTFYSAASLPQHVWDAFNMNPFDSNIMSAYTMKTLAQESAGEPLPPDQLWIMCGSERNAVDLALSCTSNSMGTLPIFIFSPNAAAQHDAQFLQPRIERLVDTLFRTIPYQRVYSVFAPELISTIFVALWTKLALVPFYREPYYAAKLVFCTKRSFINRQVTIHPDLSYELRLGIEDDIPEVAALCHGFAMTSEPFVLTEANALREATLLVQSGQVWIHRVSRPGQPSEIASIVAVTRDSDPVSAITKVFTNPKWRRLGCAERLVRYVCKQLFVSRECVILFVAHNNVDASNVYHKVGFVGLDKSGRPVEGVNGWLEIGFDRKMVDLGHW